MRQLQLAGEGEEPMIQRIDSEVKLTKNIVLPPRQAFKTMGMAKIPVLSKRVNVSTDGNPELDQGGMELLPSYDSMKPGSNRVAVALFNNSGKR